MKKIKLLPLLLAAPLLVGCGAKPSEPKFVEMSKKELVTGDKFGVDFEAAFLKSEFGVAKLLPSSVLKIESKIYNEQSIDFDGKTIAKGTTGINAKAEAKYDKANKVISVVESEEDSSSAKTSEGSSGGSLSYKSTTYYQEAKVNKEKYVVAANKEEKTIANYQKLGEKKAQEVVDGKMKGLASEWANGYYCEGVYSLYEIYMDAVYDGDTKEAAKYKFYEKGKIFTIEYSSEVKKEDVKYYETVVGKKYSKVFKKVQIDLTVGKEKATSWSTEEESIEIKKDYYEYDFYSGTATTHYKGNTEKSLSQSSEVVTFEHKDVNVKPLDISKFVQVGNKW